MDLATVIVRVLSHAPSLEVLVILIVAAVRVSGRFVLAVGAILAYRIAVCGTPVVARLTAYRVDTGMSRHVVGLHTPAI